MAEVVIGATENAGVVQSKEGERPKDQLSEAEQRGLDNFNTAKEWVTTTFDKGKQTIGKAGKFLGRMGLNILGARSHAEYAGQVVTEKGQQVADTGREAYKHVSEGVKGKAAEIGQKATETWGRITEAKDRAAAWGENKLDQVAQVGIDARNKIVSGIDNAADRVRVMQEMAKINAMRKAEARTVAREQKAEAKAVAKEQRIEAKMAAQREREDERIDARINKEISQAERFAAVAERAMAQSKAIQESINNLQLLKAERATR